MNELNEIADSLMHDDIEENGLTNYRKNNLKVNEVRYPAGGNAAVGNYAITLCCFSAVYAAYSSGNRLG